MPGRVCQSLGPPRPRRACAIGLSCRERPASPQEKITAIHHLARDEDVAATVTSDFLKRPTVAAKVSDQDKVRVAEEFTRDEHVATQVTTGLLRRPEVAFKAMSDDTAPPPGQSRPG